MDHLAQVLLIAAHLDLMVLEDQYLEDHLDLLVHLARE
jgi:hypothetical protein